MKEIATAGLQVPEGWTLEALPRQPDHVLVSTPLPMPYMVTIDFRLRGFRQGYSVTGLLVGGLWNERRKQYKGPRWRQALIDDAVTYLRKVLQ